MAKSSWIRVQATKVHLDATTVNAIIKDTLKREAESITQNPELRRAIGEAYIDVVTPFVPQSRQETSGQLRESGRATDDGRVYWTAINPKTGYNYAYYAFDELEENWPGGEYAKPNTDFTYPRWTDHVQPDAGNDAYDAFLLKAREAIIEAFRRDLNE